MRSITLDRANAGHISQTAKKLILHFLNDPAGSCYVLLCCLLLLSRHVTQQICNNRLYCYIFVLSIVMQVYCQQAYVMCCCVVYCYWCCLLLRRYVLSIGRHVATLSNNDEKQSRKHSNTILNSHVICNCSRNVLEMCKLGQIFCQDVPIVFLIYYVCSIVLSAWRSSFSFS